MDKPGAEGPELDGLEKSVKAEVEARIAFKESYNRLIEKMSPEGKKYFYEVSIKAKAIAMEAYNSFVAGMTPEQRQADFSMTSERAAEESFRDWLDDMAGLKPEERDAFYEREARSKSLRSAARREIDSRKEGSGKRWLKESRKR